MSKATRGRWKNNVSPFGGKLCGVGLDDETQFKNIPHVLDAQIGDETANGGNDSDQAIVLRGMPARSLMAESSDSSPNSLIASNTSIARFNIFIGLVAISITYTSGV